MVSSFLAAWQQCQNERCIKWNKFTSTSNYIVSNNNSGCGNSIEEKKTRKPISALNYTFSRQINNWTIFSPPQHTLLTYKKSGRHAARARTHTTHTHSMSLFSIFFSHFFFCHQITTNWVTTRHTAHSRNRAKT